MAKRRRTKTKKSKSTATWRTHAGNALTMLGTKGLNSLKKKLGLNTEGKYWDLTATKTSSATFTSFLTPTSGIAQGITPITRVGSGLRITHWNVKGYVQSNATLATSSQVRIVVAYQADADQGLLTAAELFQVPGNLNTPYNHNLQGVRILKDKTIVLNPQFSTDSVIHRFNFKINPSYTEGHVKWTDADTTGADANLIQGGFYTFIITDVVATFPTYSYYSRTHYVDN